MHLQKLLTLVHLYYNLILSVLLNVSVFSLFNILSFWGTRQSDLHPFDFKGQCSLFSTCSLQVFATLFHLSRTIELHCMIVNGRRTSKEQALFPFPPSHPIVLKGQSFLIMDLNAPWGGAWVGGVRWGGWARCHLPFSLSRCWSSDSFLPVLLHHKHQRGRRCCWGLYGVFIVCSTICQPHLNSPKCHTSWETQSQEHWDLTPEVWPPNVTRCSLMSPPLYLIFLYGCPS